MTREKIRIQLFKAHSQLAGRVERGEAIVLNQRAALAMVIIQITCDGSGEQRGEMVKASAYADLCRKHLATPEWRTQPFPIYECSMLQLAAEPVKIPKLLRAYLTLGAKICGPPALDKHF